MAISWAYKVSIPAGCILRVCSGPSIFHRSVSRKFQHDGLVNNTDTPTRIPSFKGSPFSGLQEVQKCKFNPDEFDLDQVATRMVCASGPMGHITITTKNDSYRWGNGSEQCNTLRRLQRALARAAAAPLDITVYLINKPDMGSKQQKRATKLLQTLLRTSSRWVSLKIEEFSMHDLVFRYLEKDYGALRSLKIECDIPQRLVQAIGRSSNNPTAPTFQIKDFLAPSWWSRLTTLSYQPHSRYDNPADRIQVLDTIAQCTLLRRLHINTYSKFSKALRTTYWSDRTLVSPFSGLLGLKKPRSANSTSCHLHGLCFCSHGPFADHFCLVPA